MSGTTNDSAKDSANESDDPFADSAPAAPADKPRRKRGNQLPDTRRDEYWRKRWRLAADGPGPVQWQAAPEQGIHLPRDQDLPVHAGLLQGADL